MNPVVRGHAAFAGLGQAQNSQVCMLSSPISTCLAIPSDPSTAALRLLPQRYSDDDNDLVGASAKISSWCSMRRPLEDPTRLKIPGSGVGEVLLVRQIKDKLNNQQLNIDSLEILEGLISNLFVIYKDGSVRTAPGGSVLSGYARQLVVECLDEIPGLRLDESNAPTVKDAKDGLWAEVFVTSAIRLVIPVDRVVIPSVGSQESTTLWQLDDCDAQSGHPLTQTILSSVYDKGYTSATIAST